MFFLRRLCIYAYIMGAPGLVFEDSSIAISHTTHTKSWGTKFVEKIIVQYNIILQVVLLVESSLQYICIMFAI